MEKQVGFPTFIDRPHKLSDKGHMIGAHWSSPQRHGRFFRRSVPLPVITIDTCAHQVFPRIFTTSGERKNVVKGKCQVASAAKLTSMSVPPKDVLSGEDNILVRESNIHSQSQDTWEWHCQRNGA